jgi:hypothetical protein
LLAGGAAPIGYAPAPMRVNVGPSDSSRYGWPGAAGEALRAAATRIARQLARLEAPVIGLVPVDERANLKARLAPLLVELAEAFVPFLAGEVAIVDSWHTWSWGEALSVGAAAAHRTRWLRPRVLEIAPVPCGDADAANVALENALAGRPNTVEQTLVNLGGYASPGVVPAPVRYMDGAVMVMAARRTRGEAVAALATQLPAGKDLGAILIG